MSPLRLLCCSFPSSLRLPSDSADILPVSSQKSSWSSKTFLKLFSVSSILRFLPVSFLTTQNNVRLLLDVTFFHHLFILLSGSSQSSLRLPSYYFPTTLRSSSYFFFLWQTNSHCWTLNLQIQWTRTGHICECNALQLSPGSPWWWTGLADMLPQQMSLFRLIRFCDCFNFFEIFFFN